MKSAALALACRVMPLLPGAASRPLSILIFHRVMERRDAMRPGEPTLAEFEWQVGLLRRHFTPLPLLEAIDRLQAGTLPPRACCVTFDDGYADNARIAAPVLARHGVPATIFISTGYLNGGRMWNDSVIETVRHYPHDSIDLESIGMQRESLASAGDRCRVAQDILLKIKHLDPAERQARVAELAGAVDSLPGDLMMTDDEVRGLSAAGIDVGAHTVSHPILASVSPDLAREEIVSGKRQLEDIAQRAVELFAYPNGMPGRDYGVEHRDMVREAGFRGAVSTHWGVAGAGSDHFQLPRFTPWDREPLRFGLRLLLNCRRGDSLSAGG